MDKEVLIAIIGAISVLGAALFQSGLIPELIPNDGPKENTVDELSKNASLGSNGPGPSEASTDIKSNATAEKVAKKVVPAFFSEEDPAVAVSSWGPGRLDLFVRGKDGALYHMSGDGSTTWSDWEQLDEVLLTSAPAAVSRKPNTIDVFAIGEDNGLMHKRLEGSIWSDWVPLGGNWTSAPAASSWGEDRLDVFVRGTDNALYHRQWDGSSWSKWVWFGGNLTSAPAAVSWGPGVIHVLVKGTDGVLCNNLSDGKWSGWMQLPNDITFTSAPTVSSPGENGLNVFIRGEDKALWHSWWDGSQLKWSSWGPFGGKLTSAPVAVSWGSNRIDVFAKEANNILMHKWYVFPNWYPNEGGFESICEWP